MYANVLLRPEVFITATGMQIVLCNAEDDVARQQLQRKLMQLRCTKNETIVLITPITREKFRFFIGLIDPGSSTSIILSRHFSKSVRKFVVGRARSNQICIFLRRKFPDYAPVGVRCLFPYAWVPTFTNALIIYARQFWWSSVCFSR
jgi:hypothetical protein